MNRLILILSALFVMVSCQKGGQNTSKTNLPPTTGPVAAGKSASDEVLARVNGEDITDSQVSLRMKGPLSKFESQIFAIKRKGLDQIIEEKLLETKAKKEGLTIEELLKRDIDAKIVDPTDQEVQNFYNTFKKKLGDQPLDKIRPQLVNLIKSNKQNDALNDYLKDLKKQAKVEVLMQTPRVEVSIDDDPTAGPKDAPITLIEFSDYQCPFCKRVTPTITELMTKYDGKIRRVFRDFPLSFHKQARKAAEAASCAGDQDKYWEYNHILWNNQQALDVTNLKEYAAGLKLDTAKFNECLDSGKFTAEVDKDISDGEKAGVGGTPAYFINGVFISGAVPIEKFEEVIDEELERLGK